MSLRTAVPALLAALLLPARLLAQIDSSLIALYPADVCPSCADWNMPQSPFGLFGNTYYVGTRGLSAILITSPRGHVLIDGALPNSAPSIMANIRALGFEVSEIALILNSHAHFDHAGGIAAIQRESGARVAASAAGALVMESGRAGPDDPQRGVAHDFPAISAVERIEDGAVLRVGSISVQAHFTAGHTPGGTSWSWQSCDSGRCLSFVYADSQTPISAADFRFTDSDAYPDAVADFERGFAVLEQLSCDVLLTPHPGASSLWQRLEHGAEGLIDSSACRRYAASARQQLARRLERESANR